MPGKPKPKPKPAPRTPRHLEQPPRAGCKAFLFGTCLVEQRGATLTVTLPPSGLTLRGGSVDRGIAWSSELLPGDLVTLQCAGRAQTRLDGTGYPRRPRWTGGARVVFQGGATWCRLLLDEGPVLLVQAVVVSVKGLPRGFSLDAFETVRFEPAHEEVAAEAPLAPSPRGAMRMAAAGAPPDEGEAGGPHEPWP